jgi:N-acylneuraminate cytidylyltransferase/CMP-N,N'-diacetyllegionaminic acid synthase
MVLCSICARGGSKGVKNKNLRVVAGMPLIAHSIKQAKDANIFSHIAVSSDSKDILNVAKEYGADVLIHRPIELASDTAAKLPVIQHCGREVEKQIGITFDYFVDIDATSPLRTPRDLVDSLEYFKKSGASNLITGAPARRSPYFNMVKEVDGKVSLVNASEKAFVRRQDTPECFDMNASIYIWNRESFFSSDKVIGNNTVLFKMPEERSLDIDSELDFKIVKFLMEN